jgi:hypothetical protein
VAAVPVAVPAVAARQVRAAAVARPVLVDECLNNKPKPECSALLSAPTNKSNWTEMDSELKKFVPFFTFIYSIFMAIPPYFWGVAENEKQKENVDRGINTVDGPMGISTAAHPPLKVPAVLISLYTM